MKRRLGIDDVLLQVVITAAAHWLFASDWTLRGFSERAGCTIPAALILVAMWRAGEERYRNRSA